MCVCATFEGGGEGVMMACILMCDGQGLDDDDARVIAENLGKFKRLKRLELVSWGRGRQKRGGWLMCVLRHVV